MKFATPMAAIAAVSMVGGSLSAAAAETDSKRPNIILVMADDQGWGDVAYNGNAIVKPPPLTAMDQRLRRVFHLRIHDADLQSVLPRLR